MELQQSRFYTRYITLLGWHVKRIDGVNIFFRHIPLVGGFAKVQRSKKLPAIANLRSFIKDHHIRTIAIEPDQSLPQRQFSRVVQKLRKYVKVNASPFLPTKTIRVDLTPAEEIIFQRFAESKRRAVRRAQKHNVTIQISENISELIAIKNKSAGMFGFITTHGVKELYGVLGIKRTAILLAYSEKKKPVGGIFLLFWDRVAYYWIAGATREGKKLFAPTLLVWEALKVAKQRGARRFDFVGVWDERMPHKFSDWKGFTKFKEGFGGKTLYYPIALGQ